MKNKYLLIAISAFFLLTFATSCNNSKGANDKSEIEENTENWTRVMQKRMTRSSAISSLICTRTSSTTIMIS